MDTLNPLVNPALSALFRPNRRGLCRVCAPKRWRLDPESHSITALYSRSPTKNPRIASWCRHVPFSEGKIIGEIQRGPTTKDGESKQQEEFLTAVHDWRGEQSFEARELADDFRQGNLDPNCLPSDIADSLSKPSFGKMLGRAFGKKKEARSEEYRIVRVSPGTKSKKAVRWKIVREAEEGF